jgi:hypothetical protein
VFPGFLKELPPTDTLQPRHGLREMVAARQKLLAFLGKSVTNKKLDCYGPAFEKQEPVCSHEVLLTILTERGTLFGVSKFICKSYEVWLGPAASLLKPYHRLSTSTTQHLLLYMSAHFLKCYVIYFYTTQFFADLFLYMPVHKLYFINYNYLSVVG